MGNDLKYIPLLIGCAILLAIIFMANMIIDSGAVSDG